MMRATGQSDDGLFSYVSLQERMPGDHPLRARRTLVDRVLARAGRHAMRRIASID